MPKTAIARCTASTSSMASRIERIAMGSPQPGHNWCSLTSMSAGLKSSTRRACSGGGVSVRTYREDGDRSEVIEYPLDAAAQDGGVEIGCDAEAGAVEAQAADEVHRRPTQHRQPHVVEHLALVFLVDRERLGGVGDARDHLARERQQRDRTDVADAGSV